MDINTLRETGLGYVEYGREKAVEAAEKARVQVLILNDQAKIKRLQCELGALVYNLSKAGESNQPLMDKYIEEIAELEDEIARLSAGGTAEAQPEAAAEQPAAAEAPQAHVCPQCGAPAEEGALFCNKCGAQLK